VTVAPGVLDRIVFTQSEGGRKLAIAQEAPVFGTVATRTDPEISSARQVVGNISQELKALTS